MFLFLDKNCKNCQKFLKRHNRLNPDAETHVNNLPTHVFTVANNLLQAKERRKKRKVAEQVEEIIGRISAAYDHYGVPFTLVQDSDEYDDTSYGPGGINVELENEKVMLSV